MSINRNKNTLFYIFAILFTNAFMGAFIVKYIGYDSKLVASIGIGLITIFLIFLVKHPRRLFLILLLLSLPIVINKSFGSRVAYHSGGPSSLYFTFYDFTIFLLFLLWLAEAPFSKIKSSLSRLDLCFFGLIIMAFLSMLNAKNVQLSFYMIFRFVIIYFIFYYLKNALDVKSDLKPIILSLLFGLTLESFIGVSQYFSGGLLGLNLLGESEKTVSFRSILRIGGTLGHPNNLAKYLVLLIPLPVSLFLFVSLKKIYRILCFLIIFLSIFTLVLTLSRAAWIAFIFSMFVLILLGVKARFFNLSKLLLIVLSSITLISAIAFGFHEMIEVRLFTGDYGSARSRISQMKVALNIIKHHPFIGVGINNYFEVMHLYDNTFEMITLTLQHIVHNSYLLIASEMGLPALFFFFLFVIFLFKYVVDKDLNDQNKLSSAVKIGLFSGQCSFLLQTTVMPTDLVSTPFLIFWIFSGVIVALGKST